MKKIACILKPLMPILAAAYGYALIYLTALPLDGDSPTIASDLLSCLLTLVCIILTFFLVKRVEPKWFTSARQFSLKMPKWPIIIGLLMIAPLWLVAEGYLVYGLTSLFHTVQLETLTYTTSELREDLTASIHAVLLAGAWRHANGKNTSHLPDRYTSHRRQYCTGHCGYLGSFATSNEKIEQQ